MYLYANACMKKNRSRYFNILHINKYTLLKKLKTIKLQQILGRRVRE